VSTIGGRREIKVYSLRAAKLIVDVTGYYTSDVSLASQDGLFVPVDPVRLLDTRDPGQIGKLWPNWVVEAVLPPAAAANAAAAVVNVTGVETRGPGYLTVSAARQPIPGTSNVNWTDANQVVPNHVIMPVTDRYGISVFSSHGAHVLVDLAGYFTGRPLSPTVQAYVNPPPPAAPPPWVLTVPRLGLTSSVREGDPRVITDAGHSWHWTGTGFMGQEGAHVAIFAHRTEAGAPLRHLDQMQNGDLFAVTTGDAREYTYRVVRRDLTDSQNQNILNAVRAHPGTTLSLVACTVGYDSSKPGYPDPWAATSLKYRIIVTAELVSWRQV
jgi:LPXTG-site transpeptidase (sortase) family protein